MTMNANPSRRSATTYRWIRQFHLWIGAWGALAAILYGITGLVMNHRFGLDAWPQGDSSELGKTSLLVPAEARGTPEQLSLWLRAEQGLDAQVIRKGSPGKDGKPVKWTLGGGTASDSWSLDYVPGVGNVGDPQLNELIEKNKIPFGVFGHILEAGARGTFGCSI